MTVPQAIVHCNKRAPRGQMMIIFALMLTIFMGACVLGIDIVVLRAQSENAQRAANAAALAGVIFMPSYLNNAYAYARDQATRNGYTDGQNGISVSPAAVPGYSNRLKVTISAPVHLPFAGVFGSALRTISRSAIGEFYQPLETGAPDNVLGYAPFPTTMVSPTAQEGFYLENKGNYEYKESGDAYSPYFESYIGKHFLSSGEIQGTGTLTTTQCFTPAPDHFNCQGTNGTTTTNADASPNSSTKFNGYDYIIDDPVTNTMVIKLFDPYDEIAYDARAQAFDAANNTAYAPFNSNDFTHTVLMTDSTQTAGGTCILGGSPPSCLTKRIDEPGSSPAFGTHETTLQFTLYGPAISPVDQNMPQITTVISGPTTSTTCGGTTNCVYQSPFEAGSDVTTCTANQCASPYAYRFFNYAIIHGPGIFRLNVRSVANLSDGTFGTHGNAYGIAVCGALNSGGSWRENLGNTSDPFTNAAPTPGWNSASCLNPNDPSNGGQCANPSNPASGALCIHVYGLGKMAIHNWLSGGQSLIPLGYIPPEYANKTLLIRLYDVGDVSSGPTLMAPLTPAGDASHLNGALNNGYASVQPYSYAASPNDGCGCTQGYLNQSTITSTANMSMTVTTSGGTHVFNGSWLTISVPLIITGTNTYAGMVQNFGGYWKMIYDVPSNATADDATTWSIAIAGSPLHLVYP